MFNERPKTMILNFYMKSGNVIRLNNVTEFEMDRDPGDVTTRIKMDQHNEKNVELLLIKSIDFTQIEAVTIITN